MYTLTRAFCRRDPRQSRWTAFDAADVPITTLTATYGDVWLFVTYPSSDGERAVRVREIANRLTRVTDPTQTVQGWLTAIGNQTLPFADRLPTFTDHYVHYTNAWHAGYEIAPIARQGTVEQGGSNAYKEDLRVRRADADPYYLGQHAMFTVNGFFHPVDVGPNGVYILNGNQTLRRGNDNQIGLYSFADVGSVEYIPITEAMLTPQRDDLPLNAAVYATIPETYDITNKTLLVVIGGYLHALGKGYTRTGERTYRIQLNHLSLLERYYDSRDHVDLSSLGVSEYDFNPALVSLNEIFSDVAVRAYLTLPQSFFVAVDAEVMFHELEALEALRVPDRYLDYDYQHLPLVGAYGRALEHHAIYEAPYHLLTTTPNCRQHYDFQRMPWRTMKAVDDGRYPARPTQPAAAYKRLLGVER